MTRILRKIARKIIFTLPQSLADMIPTQIRAGLGLPLGRWEAQLDFWDNWFKNEGGIYHRVYASITRPERRREVFPEFVGLFLDGLRVKFPEQDIKVLDVGSGPISPLTWGHEAGLFRLTCVDALAVEYHQLFVKYDIPQPLPIMATHGEDIDCVEEYHIVFSKNALDHCVRPATVFENMTRAVKPGGYIIIWSYVDEGSAENWSGGHQHNLDLANEHLTLTNKDGIRRLLTDGVPLRYVWSERWNNEDFHNGEFRTVYEKL